MKKITQIEKGRDIILGYARRLDNDPGCYQMLNEKGGFLYIGKAKNLKKRVAHYTKPEKNSLRIQRMIAQTHSMQFISTRNENEALLLEANLIKKHKPYYNILLRDDKSMPLILIRLDHDFPRILRHRGKKNIPGHYFGPFASTIAVRSAIETLQKLFQLRTCSDHMFAHRTRPCLQYHIKRCSAPCVQKVSKEDYAKQIKDSCDFLNGDNDILRHDMAQQMQHASDTQHYERAATLRDRIQAMSHIRARQDINIDDLADTDIFALCLEGGISCLQVFFFRNGHHYGSRSYFPRHSAEDSAEAIMAAFITQFYTNKSPPPALLTSHLPHEAVWLAKALSRRAGTKISLHCPKRGTKYKAIQNACTNAQRALARHMAETQTQKKMLKKLARFLVLDAPIKRIEIYDNSHLQGKNAVGVMVVAGEEGFIKNAYRKFTITTPQQGGGDDLSMMREVLSRRFRDDHEKNTQENIRPDLILLDGGKTQLNTVLTLFKEKKIDDIPLLAIAKGPDRNAGKERFFRPEQPDFSLKENDPLLYFLQRLRDEAHRFAIGAMRKKSHKALSQSPLDDIEGIGKKRKMALLSYFGSLNAIKEASVEELCSVSGINKHVAQKIHICLNEDRLML